MRRDSIVVLMPFMHGAAVNALRRAKPPPRDALVELNFVHPRRAEVLQLGRREFREVRLGSEQPRILQEPAAIDDEVRVEGGTRLPRHSNEQNAEDQQRHRRDEAPEDLDHVRS